MPGNLSEVFNIWQNGVIILKVQTRKAKFLLTSVFCLLSASLAAAQLPRINTLFPIGGKSGSTVDVEIRGSSLEGAKELLIYGEGVSGTATPGDGKADETNKPVWQNKCGSCHDLRSPSNRSLSPASWAATVDRMVKARQAPINAEEQTKITQYLVGAAKAGKLTAQIKIAANAPPQICEIRLATNRGVSTVGLFEVGRLPEVIAANGTREQAQPVTLPCVVNGSLANNAERNWVKFTAKQGQRLVFNMKAFRYNDQTQQFFNPVLCLYDAAGKQIAENHGYYDLDPLLDWTCPSDGEYTLDIQDLLGRGNPGNVYRLTMGAMAYDTFLFPPGGQSGQPVKEQVGGKNIADNAAMTLNAPPNPGVYQMGTPYGIQNFIASAYPTIRDDSNVVATLPCAFAGRIDKAGQPKKIFFTAKGEFDFRIFDTQLASPLAPRVKILKPDGGVVVEWQDGYRRVKFDAKGNYAIQIEDRDGHSGADYVYFVEARPAHAALECETRGDVINLRPGMSAAVEVVLKRREEIDGDVIINAPTLPNGVTATPAVISPDRASGWIIFHADANAHPAQQPIGIIASGSGKRGSVSGVAIPQQKYKIGNDDHLIRRAQEALAVAGQSDYSAEIISDHTIKIHPRKAIDVRVKVKRRDGFHNNIRARIVGLPQGWSANEEEIGGDRDEIVLHVRPDGGNREGFLKRDPTFSPITAVVEVNADEFFFVAGTLNVQKEPGATDKEE